MEAFLEAAALQISKESVDGAMSAFLGAGGRAHRRPREPELSLPNSRARTLKAEDEDEAEEPLPQAEDEDEAEEPLLQAEDEKIEEEEEEAAEPLDPRIRRRLERAWQKAEDLVSRGEHGEQLSPVSEDEEMQPPAVVVRPSQVPRPSRAPHRPSEEEFAELQEEAVQATELGIKWSMRGPAGPKEGGPEQWRGQAWRARDGADGGGRWANRGGAHKKYWASFYRLVKQGVSKEEAGRKAALETGDNHHLRSRNPPSGSAASSSAVKGTGKN
jgi:hypothetical protein